MDKVFDKILYINYKGYRKSDILTNLIFEIINYLIPMKFL